MSVALIVVQEWTVNKMTLDEAIKHCLDIADGQDKCADISVSEDAKERIRECANDHRQLAAWLTELKDLRAENKVLISECDRLIKEKGELLRKVSATEDDTNVGHKSGGWISCKDRLPSENTLVLCYARSTTGEGNSYFLGALAHGEFWFLKVNDIGHVSYPVLHWEVTHWQPLPESPKED